MRYTHEPDLVEEAVSFWLRQGKTPAGQAARFHVEREKLYRVLDPDERNAAFNRFHLSWFHEWGLDEELAAIAREFPLLEEALVLLAFRKPRSKRDEGSELYVNSSGQRHGVVALSPQRLSHTSALRSFLRHELAHLHDMIDPAFEYFPALLDRGASAGQERLARERYRMLWDITIDGRLERRGHHGQKDGASRKAELQLAFGFWSAERQTEVFDELWNGHGTSHRKLRELVINPRELGDAIEALPGAPCPLCNFPTFDWADANTLPPETISAIQAEFPEWTTGMGVCGRCADVYKIASLRATRAVAQLFGA